MTTKNTSLPEQGAGNDNLNQAEGNNAASNQPEGGAGTLDLKTNIQPQTNEQPATQAEAPQWVKDLLQSNADVIASNENVLKGLDNFKEHAGDFVDQLAKEVSKSNPAGAKQAAPKERDGFDEDARYFVVAGAQLRDATDARAYFKEGDEVTHLGSVRLKNLYQQGLIEEK